MSNVERNSKRWNIGLWILQVLLAALFTMAGLPKATKPIAELAKMLPWAATMPEALIRFIGISELAGAVGLILPGLTGVAPKLTAWAGVGLATVMLLAAGFHASRQEWSMLPFVLVLGLLPALVAWGRFSKAPLGGR